ncbi:hypothetical protein DCC62_17730, partial [candidate division KSB1 bacterium]
MEQNARTRLDDNLLGEIVNKAVTLTQAERGCLLLYDPVTDLIECRTGADCHCFAEAQCKTCAVPLQEAPPRLRQFFNGHNSSGYISASIEFPTKPHNGVSGSASQMLVPLRRPNDKSLGLLIFESSQSDYFQQQDIVFAQAIADFCALTIEESQRLANSDRMIRKLRLISSALNVLLAEFENKKLTEKFDYIVERATEILDAELCSLWLVKDGNVILETSFAQDGKVRNKERVMWPIKDGPGMTGYIAYRKEVFNCCGKELDNHPARRAENPSEFVFSKKVFSELAYPMLDDDGNLLGLLFAYNKKDANGQPLKNAGFSREFDEPLMKILTTKLVISIKNARLLKK